MASTVAGASVAELHGRAVEAFRSLVQQVSPEGWSAATPCAEWDVRALVNHVAGEELWTVPLLEGRTIAEVGERFDGDVLGGSPTDAVDGAAKAAVAAFDEPGAAERTVHLSFGDTPAAEYGMQLVADHVVHGWDLAVATGADPHVDPELVTALTAWFAEREDLYRSAGAVSDRPTVPTRNAQEELLVAFGRDPSWSLAHDVVRRFGAAWEAWDLDAIMALMADDAVFSSTGPAPDGRRIEGAPAIRAEWESMFRDTRDASFTFEEAFMSGDRATARWVFAWTNDDGSPGHVRGIDAIRVSGDRIAEKLSYVKG
jgi:uncharacterized protein (TIGR03086 family)